MEKRKTRDSEGYSFAVRLPSEPEVIVINPLVSAAEEDSPQLLPLAAHVEFLVVLLWVITQTWP